MAIFTLLSNRKPGEAHRQLEDLLNKIHDAQQRVNNKLHDLEINKTPRLKFLPHSDAHKREQHIINIATLTTLSNAFALQEKSIRAALNSPSKTIQMAVYNRCLLQLEICLTAAQRNKTVGIKKDAADLLNRFSSKTNVANTIKDVVQILPRFRMMVPG